MFCQVDLGKGTATEQAEQPVIAKGLSHTVSHIPVLSRRKDVNTQGASARKHVTLTRELHAYHSTCMVSSEKRIEQHVFMDAFARTLLLTCVRRFLFRVFVSILPALS